MSEPGSHEFTVASSQDVHIGRILGLRVDEVVMPGGATAAREVVEHLGAVGVCAVDDEGAVTLVHQYRHPLGDRLWELPAGLLDHDGEEPLTTARRELVEEAGLEARRWDTLVDIASSPGFTDEVVRVFLARELTEVDRRMHGDEEADLVVAKVALTEAVRMVLAGRIVNGPTVGGLLAAHALLHTEGLQARGSGAPWRHRPTKFASRAR